MALPQGHARCNWLSQNISYKRIQHHERNPAALSLPGWRGHVRPSHNNTTSLQTAASVRLAVSTGPLDIRARLTFRRLTPQPTSHRNP